jgi:hypothetical protein
MRSGTTQRTLSWLAGLYPPEYDTFLGQGSSSFTINLFGADQLTNEPIRSKNSIYYRIELAKI